MKTEKNLNIGVVLIACIIFAGISTFFILPTSQETFEFKIHNLMTKYKIPSLAAGIAINESIVWINGFGEQSPWERRWLYFLRHGLLWMLG